MKADKKGRLKLTSADYRVGNFVYTMYADKIGLQDINSRVVIRWSRESQMAQLIDMAIHDGMDNYLHALAALFFRFCETIPDDVYARDVLDAMGRLTDRYVEKFGKSVSESEDKEVIEEERALHEFEEEVKAAVPDSDEGE